MTPEDDSLQARDPALLDALRKLGDEGPRAETWERVAARLSADPGFRQAAADHVEAATRGGRLAFDWRWVAIAAVLLLVAGGSFVVLQRTLWAPATTQQADATRPGTHALVSTIESELDQAAKHYENAIAGLEQVAGEADSPLDPVVMATVRENLRIIDRAIDDSRQALRSDPESQLAQESLFDAFRRKVSLLQDTIALMNEMRKGNPDGATAIVSGLGTKG